MYAKNTWEKYKDQLNEVFDYNEGYKHYISKNKTERACVKDSIKLAEEKGFKPLESFDTLKSGDKVYVTNRGKNIALFIIGKKPLTEGMRILGAHIDSPRMDLKQNPLYESEGFTLADTHYYGGIKKYQWVTIPLSLYGVVCKKDGTVVDVVIGEDENDPVVGISDLLIHLSADQLDKKAAKVIEGENLDVTLGNMPLFGEEKDAVKANVLKLLKEKYKDKIQIETGFEVEYLPGQEDNLLELKNETDKIILGQHFVYNDKKTDLLVFRKSDYADDEKILKYAEYVKTAIEKKIPDIIAHPDLFVLGREKFGKIEEKVTHMICSIAEEYGIPLEINLSNPNMYLLGKKDRIYYPSKEFWKIASEYKNLKVVYGIDAHFEYQIVNYEKAIEVVNKHIGKDIINKLNFCNDKLDIV